MLWEDMCPNKQNDLRIKDPIEKQREFLKRQLAQTGRCIIKKNKEDNKIYTMTKVQEINQWPEKYLGQQLINLK